MWEIIINYQRINLSIVITGFVEIAILPISEAIQVTKIAPVVGSHFLH